MAYKLTHSLVHYTIPFTISSTTIDYLVKVNHTSTLVYTHLEFVLLSVDNDSSNLLVHKDEDGDEKSGEEGGQIHPPWISAKRGHKPTTIWTCRLDTHTHTHRKMHLT